MAVGLNWILYIPESMGTGLVWIREFGVCGSIMERFKREEFSFYIQCVCLVSTPQFTHNTLFQAIFIEIL